MRLFLVMSTVFYGVEPAMPGLLSAREFHNSAVC
jgi:hypothetical protein